MKCGLTIRPNGWPRGSTPGSQRRQIKRKFAPDSHPPGNWLHLAIHSTRGILLGAFKTLWGPKKKNLKKKTAINAGCHDHGSTWWPDFVLPIVGSKSPLQVPPPHPPSECFQLFVAQNFRVFVTMLAKSIQRHTLRKSRTSGVLSGSTMTSSTVWMRYGCHCGSVRWPTTLTPVLSLMLLLVSVETLSLATVTTATRMHYIHWNTTNPM